jgi:hypothetical protein
MKHEGSSRGNGAIAILIHDESQGALAVLENAVLSAFRHLGIPFRLLVIGGGLSDDFFRTEAPALAGVFFAQPGSLARLSASARADLAGAVEKGLGMVAYEPGVQDLPVEILRLAGIDPSKVSTAPFTAVVTSGNGHFITRTRVVGDRVTSSKALTCSVISPARPGALIASEAGHPLIHAVEAGRGRFVLFPFDVRLFTMEHLGHACGLDDVFLKSILWTARKPFATYSMPPMAMAAIDDCSGSYNHFRWVDTMNAHGWIPNLALFTDAIDEVAHENKFVDSKKLRALWTDGLADIGFHALRYNECFGFEHLGQKTLTRQELDARFARWDYYQKKWDIVTSPWIHPHFGEIGLAAVPYFRARGAQFISHILPFDASWFEVPTVKPHLPPQPPYGHNGYYISLPPECPDLLSVNCVLENKTRESTEFEAKADYLWNNTVFWDEAPDTRLGEIAQTISEQVRRGIDSGFWGQTLTHEQRIACLKMGEWEEIWQEADRLLERYHLEFRRPQDVLAYVKKWRKCSLAAVEVNGADRSVRYELDSDEAVGTRLQLHRNAADGGVETAQHEILARTGLIRE